MIRDWREPSGINFRCRGRIPIQALTTALCRVASFLQADDPYARLVQYDDWLQHDGLVFLKRAIDFDQLFSIVGTPRVLYEAMPDDDEVRIGVAQHDLRWYLRMFADWDQEGPGLEGDFDLTLPAELADRFRAEVVPGLPCEMDEEGATSYFRRIIVGGGHDPI